MSTSTQGTRQTSWTYGADGMVATVTNPLNEITAFTRDANGRVTATTRPDLQQTLVGYDALGHIIHVMPPGKPTHDFTFDNRELASQYTPPDASTGPTPTAYTHNLDKQILDVDQPGPRNVHYTYDSAGRPSSETFPTGAISRTYDSAGRLATLSGPASEVLTYAYDGTLLTSTTFSGEVAGTIARTYDNDFRLTNETVNGGMAAAVAYDPDSLVVGAGALTVGRVPQNGRVTGTAVGTVTDSYTYNDYGEVSGYASATSSTALVSFTYERDPLGRISEKTETVLGVTRTLGYTYNDVGRLTQVTENGDLVESYSYDANGNRTASINGAGVFAATFDDQDRMQTYDDVSYTYSANGELAYKIDPSDGTTAYTYDAVGNLRRVVLPSGMDIEYVVDGEGRRIGKKVNGVLTTGWLWRSKLQPVAELDGAGNVVARFVYASGGGGNNVPELMVTAGATYRLVKDHLGSVRVVVDVATGAVAQEMSYDAWGRVLVDTKPGFQPFGFAGGLYEADTGLVRLGARDYEARVGRWTSRDPIGLDGGANLFAYVLGDPVNLIDPYGLIGTFQTVGEWAQQQLGHLKPADGSFSGPNDGASGAGPGTGQGPGGFALPPFDWTDLPSITGCQNAPTGSPCNDAVRCEELRATCNYMQNTSCCERMYQTCMNCDELRKQGKSSKISTSCDNELPGENGLPGGQSQ